MCPKVGDYLFSVAKCIVDISMEAGFSLLPGSLCLLSPLSSDTRFQAPNFQTWELNFRAHPGERGTDDVLTLTVLMHPSLLPRHLAQQFCLSPVEYAMETVSAVTIYCNSFSKK